jgi:hypothetical protein
MNLIDETIIIVQTQILFIDFAIQILVVSFHYMLYCKFLIL